MIDYEGIKLFIEEGDAGLLGGVSVGGCLNQVKKVYEDGLWKDDSVVVDIGAHKGIFSLCVAARLSVAKLWAFEPDLKNYAELFNGIIENGLEDKIIALPLAVFSKGDSRFITGCEGSGQRSFLFNGGVLQNLCQTVSIEVLNALIPGPIDYLKCDVEGAEWWIFSPTEAIRKLLRRTRIVEIETHDITDKRWYNFENLTEEHGWGWGPAVEKHEALAQLLESYGFKLWSRIGLVFGMRE